MKSKPRLWILSLIAVTAITLSGCGGGSQNEWEIIVDNKGTAPCSVYVTMDYANSGAQGSGKADVQNMAAGEKLVLLAEKSTRTIRSVKVVRGQNEELLNSPVEIHPGMRYRIVIDEEGLVKAAFESSD